MTPKEKAQDLVERYYWTFGDGYLGNQHIHCALIAVDEILNGQGIVLVGSRKYWEEVKTEIEKL